MPAAAVAGQTSPTGSTPGAGMGAVVPFFYGTNQYAEKFFTVTQTLGAAQVEVSQNINPGGFMRGVRVIMRSTTGALGGGTLVADAPYAALASISLENIDGSPIMYPMSGYAHAIGNKYFRPWFGDPTLQNGYSATVNPAYAWFIQPEIRHTAGVLANTDARAQYRIRLTFNTIGNLVTGGAPVAPAVTLTCYVESWAQPDAADLRGNPIEPLPPGMNLATLRRRQVINMSAVGADNTFQISNTGNELRGILAITRTSAGVRAAGLSDPIRWRLDNRSLGVFSPDEVFLRRDDLYNDYGLLTDTGVYVFSRFYHPGDMKGEAWLATTNATYVIFESQTAAAAGANATIEFVTDEVVPVGPIPYEMESI